MPEEFIANADENPFESLGEETTTDSQPEIKPEEEKPKEGEDQPEEADSTPKQEDVPFHEHPRWKERETKFKELEKELAELREAKKDDPQPLEPSSEVPSWFQKLYGDNIDAYREYEKVEKQREAQIEERVLTKYQEAQRKQQEETTRWNKWVDEEVGRLKDEGKEFERNEFLKLMLDYKPTDDTGNLDFNKGFTIYEALKSKDTKGSDARKKIANDTIKTSPETKKETVYTPEQLRKTSWGSI